MNAPAVRGNCPAAMAQKDWEQLYAELERPLYNAAYRWVWNESDAQEIVQDAFMRLWRQKTALRYETVRPLIWRTVLNLAANRRRGRRLRQFLGLDWAGAEVANSAGPEESLAVAQRDRAIRDSVDSLPDKLRRVIVLSEFSGFSYEAIGETLGIPIGTVGSRRSAALQKLEVALQQTLGQALEEA